MEKVLLRPVSALRRPFVLLDRDGTIIVERHYLSRPEQVELLPGAAEGLQALSRLGCGLVILTNQSGIGRGLFGRSDLERVHDKLIAELAAQGIALDAIYYCPHVPEERCACRKPAPAMAHAAAAELVFDLAEAFVIGDKACDIDLGRATGSRTILVKSGYGAEVHRRGDVQPDFVTDDLTGAARWITGHFSGESPCY